MPEAGVELAELRRPPPCPKEAKKDWDKYQSNCRGPSKMQDAVLWYLSGESLRDATRRAGIGAYQGLADTVSRCGFRKYVGKTERLVHLNRSIALESGKLLEKELIENPDSFKGKGKELAVINGINVDKALTYEASRRGADSGFIQSIGEIALAVAESGSTLSVEIRPPQIEDAIDVTPA